MDERAVLGRIDAVAHSFAVVQSVFPGWVFTAPDAVGAFGVHGALLLGPWHRMAGNEERWEQMLSIFTVDLLCDGTLVDQGQAINVLGGGPLTALCQLVGMLAQDAVNPALSAGEIVTTATLTRVPPVAPSETWTTAMAVIDLDGIVVRFA
jgi:2-oxo-3-hexenedioate decarboxylase